MKKILFAMLAVAAMAGTAMAAGSNTVGVSGTVLSTCAFSTGGTAAFGNLDPTTAANVNATMTQPTFWCTNGVAYTITDDIGLNEAVPGTAPRRMKNGVANYIPYSFTYTATGTGAGKSTAITMNIAASVAGTDYQNAPAGAYADTVTLTINP